MYIMRNYGFWLTINWTKKKILFAILYSSVICLLYSFLKQEFNINIGIPWQPIGILGTAVAFYLGFKNNSSYDRTWEARRIWGGIVNSSRSFGAAVNSFVEGENSSTIKATLIKRHVAWITAHRFQLRVSKEWEHKEAAVRGVYFPTAREKFHQKLDDELRKYLSDEEIGTYDGKQNTATQILNTQSLVLQQLKNDKYFDDFRHMDLHRLIVMFYENQGGNERIKNFPFPRQYASAALWQNLIFCALLPFGLIDIFTASLAFSYETDL